MVAKHFYFLLAASLLLGNGSAPAAAEEAAGKIDFQTQIQPLLVEHCGKCHGEKKKLGKLQLHTPAAIQDFHEDELLVAGKPDESELFQRITLPEDNKKRMPKGADPLPAEQIELIRQWIAEGALFVSADAPEKPETAAEPQASEPAEVDDAEELKDVEDASSEAIQKIEAAGARVMPLFADSPLLQVSFAQAASPPGDEALAALPAAADQIVWLNAAGAQASPAGYAALAELKNLSQLHLEKSNISDESLQYVGQLPRLKYLNLYNTQITDAGLEHLRSLTRLRKLYLWQTEATYDVAMGLGESIPGLEVSLGWNHPEVARRRLTRQIEEAKGQAEESVKQAEAAQKELEAANKAKEQAEARLKELEGELAEINQEGEPAEANPEAEQASGEEPQPEAEPAAPDEEKAEDEKPEEEKAEE